MKEENKTVTENNKLIAEFMGYGDVNTKVYFKYNCSANKLMFDSSWDWLMPVIEKIEKDKATVNFLTNAKTKIIGCTIHVDYTSFSFKSTNRLEAAYEAIIKFIKWYNSQQVDVMGSFDENGDLI